MKTLENYLGRMVNMKLCKECCKPNLEYAKMCCVCGCRRFMTITDIVSEYKEMKEHVNVNRALFDGIRNDIARLSMDKKTFTSSRISDEFKSYLEAYKSINNIKTDNEAYISLIDYYLSHSETDIEEVDEFKKLAELYYQTHYANIRKRQELSNQAK